MKRQEEYDRAQADLRKLEEERRRQREAEARTREMLKQTCAEET